MLTVCRFATKMLLVVVNGCIIDALSADPMCWQERVAPVFLAKNSANPKMGVGL
jgi:hypothetical protein